MKDKPTDYCIFFLYLEIEVADSWDSDCVSGIGAKWRTRERPRRKCWDLDLGLMGHHDGNSSPSIAPQLKIFWEAKMILFPFKIKCSASMTFPPIASSIYVVYIHVFVCLFWFPAWLYLYSLSPSWGVSYLPCTSCHRPMVLHLFPFLMQYLNVFMRGLLIFNGRSHWTGKITSLCSKEQKQDISCEWAHVLGILVVLV